MRPGAARPAGSSLPPGLSASVSGPGERRRPGRGHGDRDAAGPLPAPAAARLRADSTGSNGPAALSRGWEWGRGPTRDPASWRSVLAGGAFLTGQPRLSGGSAAVARAGQRACLRAAPPAPAHPDSGARGGGEED